MNTRILILEDDEALRESLALVLRRRGYEVDTVGRGAEAVEAARLNSYDLVVTDIRMEGMDGLEALQRLKGVQPDVDSVVVTGYSTEADSIRAIRLGVGDYLKKPFHLKDFIESVETVLNRRREERQMAGREAALRSGLGWLLEQTLKLHGRPEVIERASLAQRVAHRLGLAEGEAEWVRSLAMTAAGRAAGVQLPPFEEGFPERSRRGLQALGSLQDGSEELPLEARIVAAVLRLHGDVHYDPEVLRALEEVEDEPDTDPLARGDGAARLRGLLSLGEALEEAGKATDSEQAFRAVLDEGECTREGIRALLGLTRLAIRAGTMDQARQRALRAVGWARRLGPTQASLTALEAGVFLCRALAPEGPELLQQAEELGRTIGAGSTVARARLALRRFAGGGAPSVEDLDVLLRAEHLQELTESVEWALPVLLEFESGGSHTRLEQLLEYWAVDFPQTYRRSLELLPSASKLAAVRFLAAAGTGPARECLGLLVADPEEQVRQAAATALEGTAGRERPALLRLYSLGGFEAFVGQRRLGERDWKTQKVRYLLAYLAASGGRPIPDDTLMDGFWTGSPPHRARKSLNTALSYLRSNLGREVEYVERLPAGLRLNPDLPHWHDFDELSRAIAEVGRLGQDSERQIELLEVERRVARLYRGPYLEGCYLEWAVDRRHEVERAVTEVLADLTGRCLEMGRPQEAIEHGRRALELDPCLQHVHLALLKGHLQMGRPEEAVRQYEQCENVLRDELGMEPGTDLFREYQRALLSLSYAGGGGAG